MAEVIYTFSGTTGAPSAPMSSGQYTCQSSRKVQRITRLDDSRSMAMASLGPQVFPLHTTLRMCPNVVSQRSAKAVRSSSVPNSRHNALRLVRSMTHTIPVGSDPCQYPSVASATDSCRVTRLERLKSLKKTPRELSDHLGSTYAYWRNVLAGVKDIGEKVARRIEDGYNLPHGWLDGFADEPAPPADRLQPLLERLENLLDRAEALSERSSPEGAQLARDLDAISDPRLRFRAYQAAQDAIARATERRAAWADEPSVHDDAPPKPEQAPSSQKQAAAAAKKPSRRSKL